MFFLCTLCIEMWIKVLYNYDVKKLIHSLNCIAHIYNL